MAGTALTLTTLEPPCHTNQFSHDIAQSPKLLGDWAQQQRHALAHAYERKFHHATSATHLHWLTFFTRSLSRQLAAACHKTGASAATESPQAHFAAAQRKYEALFHAHLIALRLYRDALAKESMQRSLLADLRSCHGPLPSADGGDTHDGGANRRQKGCMRGVDSCLHWLIYVADDRIYQTIMSFV